MSKLTRSELDRSIRADRHTGQEQGESMAARREPDDVMQNLLTSQDDPAGPTLDELNSIIHRSFQMTAHAAEELEEERDGTSEEDRSARTKSTIYLAEQIDTELNNAKQIVREMMPDNLRSSISRSAIANVALGVILKDFEKKGQDSVLMKQIRKNVGDS